MRGTGRRGSFTGEALELGVYWIELVWDRDRYGTLVNVVMNLRVS